MTSAAASRASASSAALEALRLVPFLGALDEVTLHDVLETASPRRFAKGERIVAELEFGTDVFVVVEGEAEVTVVAGNGAAERLGILEKGSAFGEMSSLTGQLRSATVTALCPVEVLVLPDREFDRLRERRPEIAVALLRGLSSRLAETERTIDRLLAKASEAPAADSATSAHAAVPHASRGIIRRAFRELVVSRQRDLGFLGLFGFVLALVVTRALVYVSFALDFAPRSVLRAAYMSGFGLVGASACASLLVFRPALRRVIALAYGVGVALIFNELGVTLAFDIFFKDIHTPDPNVAFDVERLYRRTEPIRAIVIGLVVLVQLAYLRPFYRRVAFVAKTKLRKAFASR